MLDGRELPARSRWELESIRYARGAGLGGPRTVAEYEAKESPEAICARDADKLECLLQGIEYKAQGYESAQRWIDNSRSRLVTGTANRLADELLAQGSLDWLRTALGEDKK